MIRCTLDRKRTLFPFFLTLGLLCLGMTGCAGPPPPVDHHYRLAFAPPQPLGEVALSGRLEIQRFRTESIFQGRRIAYRRASDANEVRLYAYHHWSDPLPVMLQEGFGQALREAHVASEVSIPTFRIDADYVLFGRIVAFERVTGSETSTAHAEIEFALVRKADRSLMLQRTYREEVEASEPTMRASVDALSIALGKIMQSLVRDLEQTSSGGIDSTLSSNRK